MDILVNNAEGSAVAHRAYGGYRRWLRSGEARLEGMSVGWQFYCARRCDPYHEGAGRGRVSLT